MKCNFFFSFLLLTSFFSLTQKVKAQAVSHQLWEDLLQAYVTEEGVVNYNGFKDNPKLDQYLELLNQNGPRKSWSRYDKLAYWINAYNAFTVKLVSKHYPIKSIKDIKKGIPFVNTVWDIKFIVLDGDTYDLNNIEHGIIRKRFREPRIHFAVNCASESCPALLNHAYTGAKLDDQLTFQAKRFLADKTKNKISSNKLDLSKIFKWFKKDFTRRSSFIEFLNKYAPTPINKSAKISYNKYDWRLNDRKY